MLRALQLTASFPFPRVRESASSKTAERVTPSFCEGLVTSFVPSAVSLMDVEIITAHRKLSFSASARIGELKDRGACDTELLRGLGDKFRTICSQPDGC